MKQPWRRGGAGGGGGRRKEDLDRAEDGKEGREGDRMKTSGWNEIEREMEE